MNENKRIEIINDTKYSNNIAVKLVYLYMIDKTKFLAEKTRLGIAGITTKHYSRKIIYKVMEKKEK